MRYLLGFMLLVFFAPTSRAEWAVPRLATQCDPVKKVFVLAGGIETDKADPAENAWLTPGMRLLEFDTSLTVKCQIGGRKFVTKIGRIAARPQGACGGNDFHDITLWVDKTKVYEHEKFNTNSCSGPALVSLNFSFQGKRLLVKSCSGEWDTGGYRDVSCKEDFLEMGRSAR